MERCKSSTCICFCACLRACVHLCCITWCAHDAGYSIFVVEGDLPQCQAHDILLAQPAVQHVPPPLLADLEDPTDEPSHSTYSRGQCTTEADGLSEALAASRQEALAAERKQLQAALDASRVTEDDSIQQALADSRHHVPPHVAGTGTGGVAVSAALTQPTGAPSATLPVESAEVLRQKRLAFFDRWVLQVDSNCLMLYYSAWHDYVIPSCRAVI